ncbi:putative translation initiation factor aIF-2BI/5-methylthioribose-1-phosphate isomerase [Mrakia frigida]|uniref:S-methyl-5-thioribose-1-phosphate isomerase MRI1 n=1 Tax=Mrakia frigida TaxID=29902 RepID=UPI003FCBF645
MSSLKLAEDGSVQIVNQLLLPHVVQWEAVDTLEDAFDAIKSMKIRGAPAIGSLAGLVLAHVLATSIASSPRPTIFATTESFLSYLQEKTVYLNGARPTAVNLGEAMGRMYKAGEEAVKAGSSVDDAVKKVVEVGREVHVEDLGRNILMSQRGADWIAKVTSKTKDIRILTVCNTGSLATSGMGTALGVITNLSQTGRLGRAYYTQTAPYHQGSRLTSLELLTLQIPSTLLADTMVGSLFQHHQIDALVVGADRVVRNGDTANKVGTYNAAVLAKRHGVRVVIVAPEATVDLSVLDGSGIPIEQRPSRELTLLTGKLVSTNGVASSSPTVDLSTVQITPDGVGSLDYSQCYNPSFDVTPAELIDAVVTERRVVENIGGRIDMS